MKKHNDTTAHTSNNTTPANRLAAMKRPMLGFAAALAATGSISAIGSWVLHSNRAATAAMTEQPLVTAEPIAAQGAPHISTMELSDALIEAVMGAGCAGDTCQIGKLPPYEEVCCADGGYPPECDDDCGWALPAPGLTEETWETLIEDCDSGYCPSGWQIGIPPPINKPPPPQTGGGGGGGGSKPEPDLTLLGLGTVSEAAIDASIPGVTFPAEFGRTYNSKRITEGESTSQGIKWRGGIIEMFLKEQGSDILVMVDAATSRLMDWNGSSFDPPVDFKGTFEKSGSGASETYTLTSLESGEVYKFYSINSAIPSAWAGRLKERTDVYGTESITYDYSNAGQVESATTSQGWAVEFTYDATHERRTQIELKDGSGTVIQEVNYTYYEDVSGTKTHLGSNGDLVAVEVKFRTSDVSDWIVQNTHYRYYRSGDSDGEPHQMKAVFDAAAIETINSVGDSSVDTPSEILNKADDYTVSGGNDIIEYATRAYTYYTSDLNTGSSVSTPWGSQNLQTKYGGVNLDESGSVKTMVTMGACATCGDSGQIGVGQKSTFFYIRLNATPSSNNDVAMLVIEDLEDSSGNEVSRQISGVNEQQHRLRYIVIEDPTDTTPDVWCRSERIDSDQRVTERRSPSAHTLVNTDAEVEDFLDPEDGSNDTNTLNSSTGEIISYEYNSDHYVTGTRLKKGRTGTSYFVSATDWGNGTNDKPKHFRTATYEYFTKTTTRTAGEKTSFAYQFHDAGDTRLKRTETTFPIVSSGQNGSGVATTTYDYYDSSGRKRWEKDGEGYVTYIAQHPDVGGESYRMIDVDTASLNSEITSGSSGKWIAWSGSVPTGLTRDAGLDSALEITGKTEFDDLGRKSKEIGASGAEHYMVYDTNQTMRFRYWDTVSDEPAYAISVEETDDGGRVIEQYSVKPSRAANTSSVPTGLLAGTTQAHYVTWVKLNYDDEGVLESQDRYHDIPSSGNGTLSSNFYRTINQYDEMGRVEYTVEIVSGTSSSAGVEQVTWHEYDFLGRPIRIKRGTSAKAHNMGSSYTTYPTLTTVSDQVYDFGGSGDGLITKVRQWHDTGTFDYTGVNNHYDFRGRLRGTEPFYYNGSSDTADGPYIVSDYDWVGNVVASAVYDTNPTWSTVTADDDYADSVATDRRALTASSFDDLGRRYQTELYTINSSTGAKGNKSVTNIFHDRLDRDVAIETVNGAAAETAYDGARRQYQNRVVTALETTKYSSGKFQYRSPVPDPNYTDMTGGDDKVISLAHSDFDVAGNVTEKYALESHHDDTNGIDLSSDDDYIALYAYSWYDDANRLSDTVAYGTATSGFTHGSAPTRTAPTSSTEDEPWTQFGYDADTGMQNQVTDSRGIVGKTVFDDLGRPVYIVENFMNFIASTEANTGGSDPSEDRVTKLVYDGLGQVTKRTALDADGDGSLSDNQQTVYLFEDAYNAALNTNIIYPDSSDTTSIGTDQVKLAYNVDGSLDQKTDQNGTVIDYTYTDDRRPELEKVTTLGSGIDGHVRSIKNEFDELDRVDTITSYSASGGTGTVRNQIVLEYNDLGQITKSWQSHEGAKSGGTPNVQYSYDLTADGNSVYDDGARLNSITYPGGRTIDYTFGSSGSITDLLSRLDAVKESSTTHLSYEYTGSGRMVRADYPVSDIQLLHDGDDADGDYEGFDRFGRTVDQRWYDYGGAADADRFQYDHDEAGIVKYRDIPTSVYASNDKDHAYTHDDLGRLTNIDTGTLSGTTISGTPATEQDFTLDALGNWSSFLTKTSGTTDLNQSRTHNDANEVSGVTETTGPTWIDPVYDDNGNMEEGPAPGSETTRHKYIFDAWNRVVEVTDSSDVTIARHEYDGRHRRIVKTDEDASPDVDYDYYFNEAWQIVEVRKDADTDPLIEMVWHGFYVDAPAYRQYDANTDGTADEQYFTFDANFNVTALINSSGTVIERYEYDPYGQVTILDADFSDDSNGLSDYEQFILFGGYRLDIESGLYEVRNRFLHATLGRWMQRDPLGYIDGGSLYLYGMGAPFSVTDPSGTVSTLPSDYPQIGRWKYNGRPGFLIHYYEDGTHTHSVFWPDELCPRSFFESQTIDLFELVDEVENRHREILESLKAWATTAGAVGEMVLEIIDVGAQITITPYGMIVDGMAIFQDPTNLVNYFAVLPGGDVLKLIPGPGGKIGQVAGEVGAKLLKKGDGAEEAINKIARKAGADKAVVDARKYDYLFGRAGGSTHNIARTRENAAQMRRLGVRDTTEGRAMLQRHFDETVSNPSNVTQTFSNEHGMFEVRDSLFAGPSGQFAKFQSTYQIMNDGSRRLTTVIPFGG